MFSTVVLKTIACTWPVNQLGITFKDRSNRPIGESGLKILFFILFILFADLILFADRISSSQL